MKNFLAFLFLVSLASCAYETKTVVTQKFKGNIYTHEKTVTPIVVGASILPAMSEGINVIKDQYVIELETTYIGCKNCVTKSTYYAVDSSQLNSLNLHDEVSIDIFPNESILNKDEIVHIESQTFFE